jgi:A/G-specific adenine glycosylase
VSRKLSSLLLSWYVKNPRSLPWRGESDPYKIWVSEIMAQQTRLQTVIPYYHRWIQAFPTIKAPANASEQDVLKNWEGLGYYSRARNLHQAAIILMEKYAGRLLEESHLLRELPGIGPYSAAAISSLAFGKNEAALDGNIRRVLARVFNVSLLLGSPECERELNRLALANLSKGKAGDYNQALMDLGSSICVPRNPNCPICPLTSLCIAQKGGRQNSLPVRKQASSLPTVIVTAAIILNRGRMLISQRPSRGLLGGMWEFPGGKLEPPETLEACLQREIKEELGARIIIQKPFGVFRHSYSHFHVELHAFICGLNRSKPKPLQVRSIQWVKTADLQTFPMGKIDRMISLHLISGEKSHEK